MEPAWELPRLLYLAAVGVYGLFFLLFLRLLLYKRLADAWHWRRRPRLDLAELEARSRALGRELPFISLLIPARNEAPVIERTLEHLTRLEYPRDRLEVVVITDQRELDADARLRPRCVAAARRWLLDRLASPGTRARRPPEDTEEVVLGLLVRLAAAECGRLGRPSGPVIPAAWLREEPTAACAHRRRWLWRQLARALATGDPGWARRGPRLVGHVHPELEPQACSRVLSAYLALALTVAVAYLRLLGQPPLRLLGPALGPLARLRPGPGLPLAVALAETLADRLAARLDGLARARALDAQLHEAAREVFPTTQALVELARRSLCDQPGGFSLRHVVVPVDFDGRLVPGRPVTDGCRGQPVPSTKGRALNYGLHFVDPRTQLCGFYDAESRPDPRVLLHVAHRRLTDGERVRILQGPVFQVRNFYRMGPLCKIASLYQAVAHEWYLPGLFRRLPFVGGTNLFVDRRLLETLGGYDPASLTEDLELGARAWLEVGAWPEYLPWPSSEQTPPTVRSFFLQRLRWGAGHLQVMDKVRRAVGCPEARRRGLLRELFLKGQVEWLAYQAATLVPPLVLFGWALGWVDPSAVPPAGRLVLHAMTAVYFGFTLYAYARYRDYLDQVARPVGRLGEGWVLAQLLLLPLAAFLFPVPFTAALVLKALGRQPRRWIKTRRTAE